MNSINWYYCNWLKTKSYLSDEEEWAGFANFTIQKLEIEDKTSLSIELSLHEGCSLFPNPVDNKLQLNFNKNYSGNLKVFDRKGKLYARFQYPMYVT